MALAINGTLPPCLKEGQIDMLRKILNGPYEYSPVHRLLEMFGLAGFVAFVAVFSWGIFTMMEYMNAYLAWFLFIKSILLAYIAADFASGFVHWLGDTFGEEDWPVLGAGFIKPFRQHHVDPKGITRHDFIEVNGNNCFVLMMFLIPAFLIINPAWGTFGFFSLCFTVFFAIGIFMTNQCHRWAHMENPPAFAHTLQRWGLILTPTNHNVHHASPYKHHYCITSGWLNPILDKINFWRVCERFMTRLTGRDYSKTTH